MSKNYLSKTDEQKLLSEITPKDPSPQGLVKHLQHYPEFEELSIHVTGARKYEAFLIRVSQTQDGPVEQRYNPEELGQIIRLSRRAIANEEIYQANREPDPTDADSRMSWTNCPDTGERVGRINVGGGASVPGGYSIPVNTPRDRVEYHRGN